MRHILPVFLVGVRVVRRNRSASWRGRYISADVYPKSLNLQLETSEVLLLHELDDLVHFLVVYLRARSLFTHVQLCSVLLCLENIEK